MEETLQKVTVHIPASLLKKAREVSQDTITETIRQSLERLVKQVSEERACQELLRMEGTFTFSPNLTKLREDKRRD